MVNIRTLWILFALNAILAGNSLAGTEAVFLLKVIDTDFKAIVERKNGDQYLIEYGTGVLSVWRYEGRAVIIYSPNQFLSVGSKLILPDDDQEVNIWSSNYIGNSKDNDIAITNEITLFNIDGRGSAYIDIEDDFTIYLLNGYPVAYLIASTNCFSIYGFNGKHMGWYENGIIRDTNGFIVGFSKGASINIIPKDEPTKRAKRLKPVKSIRKIEKLKPIAKNIYSEIPLAVFIALGSKEEVEDLFNR